MDNDKDKLLKEISEFLSKQGHFKPYDIEESDNLIARIKDIITTCRNTQLVSELDR